MSTTYHKITAVTNTETLADGSYTGVWGGFSVCMYDQNVMYNFISEIGVKTPRCPVTIHKSGNNFTMTESD